MTDTAGSAREEFLGIAIAVIVISVVAIRAVTLSIKQRLGPAARGGNRPFTPEHAAGAPQDLLKEAFARGLVTPSQLAKMSAEERDFVFASLKKTLRDEGRG